MAAMPPIMSWMHVLSDVTRARALRALERGELTVAELCAVLQLPQSTVSRHLKVLADEGWAESRREGTRRLYRMARTGPGAPGSPGDPAARRLWLLVREQEGFAATAERDGRRLERVLADRRTRSEAFFSSAAGQWDRMRADLFGARFDLLALPGLLDPAWVVGDLGCGTGQAAEAIAPFVDRVIAVDHSAAMLRAARRRLKGQPNVEVRRGSVEALPIEDDALDAATIFLVLHHLSDPGAAVAEAARALKPGGRLLIVDMLGHDRAEYRERMGHVHLGFAPADLDRWLAAAAFDTVRIHPLPPDPEAKGPALFAASGSVRMDGRANAARSRSTRRDGQVKRSRR